LHKILTENYSLSINIWFIIDTEQFISATMDKSMKCFIYTFKYILTLSFKSVSVAWEI